jgi:sulfite exporter TauE/SafE
MTGMLINFISKAIQKKLMRLKKYLLKVAGAIAAIKIPVTIVCIKK